MVRVVRFRVTCVIWKRIIRIIRVGMDWFIIIWLIGLIQVALLQLLRMGLDGLVGLLEDKLVRLDASFAHVLIHHKSLLPQFLSELLHLFIFNS